MQGPTDAHYSRVHGVPLYYARGGSSAYRVSVYSTKGMKKRLNLWSRDLGRISRNHGGPDYAELRQVITAGAYVNRSGEHGRGRAFDLDGVVWNGVQVVMLNRSHVSSHTPVRRRYLAVDAVCRRHFRYVLNGWYNAAHADHIHMDLGGVPARCRKSSRSDAVFVQRVCNEFNGAGLAVDGAWGPLTNTAFRRAKRKVGVPGSVEKSSKAWHRWLRQVAIHGFANRPF